MIQNCCENSLDQYEMLSGDIVTEIAYKIFPPSLAAGGRQMVRLTPFDRDFAKSSFIR
jgi:hypothetical protein